MIILQELASTCRAIPGAVLVARNKRCGIVAQQHSSLEHSECLFYNTIMSQMQWNGVVLDYMVFFIQIVEVYTRDYTTCSLPVVLYHETVLLPPCAPAPGLHSLPTTRLLLY